MTERLVLWWCGAESSQRVDVSCGNLGEHVA
jgi:hypothetical protein